MAATKAYRILPRTLRDVEAERKYQVNVKGYTRETDDENFPHQWIDYIRNYADKADSGSVIEYRRSMVKVAALAVAAIEAFDRAVH